MTLEYIKKKFVAFKESEWSWQRTIFAIIYLIFILIPAYHSFNWKIPPVEELSKAEGVLFFEPVPGRGSLTGLRTTKGNMVFTCETVIGRDNDCLCDTKIESSVRGRQATVYWYCQRYFLWFHRDRLVELWVGNDRIVSRMQTQKIFDISKDADMWLVPLVFLGYVVLDAFWSRFSRRKKKPVIS